MIELTVFGTPRPQGSMRAFHRPGMRFPVVTSDNHALKPWRQEITATAQSLGVQSMAQGVPVSITLAFYFARPASVSVKKRPGMTVKPDIDKTIRAVFDALKGVLIHDDAQVTRIHASKHYGDPERVEIAVSEC